MNLVDRYPAATAGEAIVAHPRPLDRASDQRLD
jgi:hypothetical protein